MLSGQSPWAGSQKALETGRKGSQKDSQVIKPPTRDLKKILVGHVISLHDPQKPWPDKDILCLCIVVLQAAGHPGLQFRKPEEAALELTGYQ